MNIKEIIKTRPILFDGAMGTLYGEYSSGNCEMANLVDSQTILSIHKRYIKAGCMAIKTNTFGANTYSMECDFEMVEKVINAGCDIAFKAAEDSDVAVFADIGPMNLNEKDNKVEYKNMINIFIKNGIKNFIFETLASDEYICEFAEYIKSKVPDAFIITQFAVAPDGFTNIGLSGKNIYERMRLCEYVDCVGFNCISGAHHLYEYVKRLENVTKYMSVMPNAGYPTVSDGRTSFGDSSDFFAQTMLDTAKLGVRILGGCCGTTPVYIEKMAKLINGNINELSGTILRKSVQTTTTKPIPNISDNRLLNKLNEGKKVIAVELDPPLDANMEFFINGAKVLKESGVDAITIADCPLARARADSSILAAKLKRELDIDAIPHMTCRDRNINATKALLLALNAEGIRNVLTVTGDPVPSPLRDEVKTMFSFNSAILAKHISELNDTIFTSPFNICGAININAKNFDSQLHHAEKKIQNGVKVLFTQPVLTEEAFENIQKAKHMLDVKIMGGIMPVVSHRNACFMNNEISGINVSDKIIKLYENIEREEASELAVKISSEIARRITDFVDGYYIITPFKRVDIIKRIVENIKNI